MNKNYTIKPTKKQLLIIKKYWRAFQAEYDTFLNHVIGFEEAMSGETGIKDLEFFNSEGDYCGVGNIERTMKLIQRDKLEE